MTPIIKHKMLIPFYWIKLIYFMFLSCNFFMYWFNDLMFLTTYLHFSSFFLLLFSSTHWDGSKVLDDTLGVHSLSSTGFSTGYEKRNKVILISFPMYDSLFYINIMFTESNSRDQDRLVLSVCKKKYSRLHDYAIH